MSHAITQHDQEYDQATVQQQQSRFRKTLLNATAPRTRNQSIVYINNNALLCKIARVKRYFLACTVRPSMKLIVSLVNELCKRSNG